MKSSSVISAGIIALGMVISGFCLKAGIDNIAFRDREVTVRGLAEREVEANLVTGPSPIHWQATIFRPSMTGQQQQCQNREIPDLKRYQR